MSVYVFNNFKPKIGIDTFVCEEAVIIGNVTIGKGCFIGPEAVLRGDVGRIKIGDYTSVQDNCIIHVSKDVLCKAGDYVTLGHGCILHGCTVKDYATVGMGALVANNAVIEEWCIVAEGCVVVNGYVSEPETILVGVPCKVIGKVTEEHKRKGLENKKRYAELTLKYMDKKNFKRIK